MVYRITSGSPTRMGAHFDGDGVNFALFSAHAHRVELCLFDADGVSELNRLTLPERTGDIWHGYVAGLRPQAIYGYRVHGPYDPEHGHRFNPNKLLIDPYTRQFSGTFVNHSATLGYSVSDPKTDLSFDARDSAPHVAKSVVPDPSMFPSGAHRLQISRKELLIYEAHAKGLTQKHPQIAEAVRGTYEGLASEPILEHLLRLGVNAIELLPVHSFLDDGFLQKKGLRNYWGYNTLGFFAPEPRYFGPTGFAGFKSMVDAFHSAGIEVILDVVYNHTAEGDHRGPTLSFRGLDNVSYYRLLQGQPRFYVNDTGTGNTVNVAHPAVLRLVMDSLRFWVDCFGIDGFRFDLATTLGREDHGFDTRGGFFDALRQDPVLAGVKLIAEPWDIGPGGYQLGGFTPEFAEWNDSYRDTVRRFWRGDAHSAQELSARLLGSAGAFDKSGRRAWSSVNFLAAHDGFTLADVTAYSQKHNAANLENNQDGHNANYSDNCGVEGSTDDASILALRQRRRRNMLATLFLSQGTPMLLAGDEFGNSQSGNNNAYCQDNDIGWLDWAGFDTALCNFVEQLSAIRRAHPALRQSRFLHGERRLNDTQKDVEWFDFEGAALNWRDPSLSSLCVLLRGSAEAPEAQTTDDIVYIVINRAEAAAEVMLPELPDPQVWMVGVDTARDVPKPYAVKGSSTRVSGSTVLALFPDTTGDSHVS
ncbi:MAG: glycogen debranching protein GlgX [Pseudomonadota bacterium]